MRVLIIEDDDALRKILVKQLNSQGYAVDACSTGTDGLDYATAMTYDAIILDIMLPGINGLEILRRLRNVHCESGVLMLTAKDAIEDRVNGLDMGADDYLTKPFALDELLARVRALMRKRTENHSPVLTVANLVMDTATHTVTRGQRAVVLTWALDGLRRLLDDFYVFSETEKTRAELTRYRVESNSVLSFVEECCELAPNAETVREEMFAKYKEYCHNAGLKSLSQRNFNKEIEAMPSEIVRAKDRLGKRRTWRGIEIVS